jgi:hypothetical protein
MARILPPHPAAGFYITDRFFVPGAVLYKWVSSTDVGEVAGVYWPPTVATFPYGAVVESDRT